MGHEPFDRRSSCAMIPPAIFASGVALFALGCLCGWAAHKLLSRPVEVLVASPRGAKGRFVKREAPCHN